MKTLYILLLLLVSCDVYAQEPDLLSNTWNLQNVILGGNDNFPPSNSEVVVVTAHFFDIEFFTAVCDALSGSIVYDSVNPEFTLNAGLTLGGCSLPENTAFQIIYLQMFYFNHMSNPFSYLIVDEGNGSKTLTVTNSSGDEAIYGNQMLAVDDEEFLEVTFFPNPVNDLLYFSSNNIGDFTLFFYDINGKEIIRCQKNDINNGINLSSLNSGIYFLKLVTDSGSVTKKIIKH